ncbi:uncharacterized protein LOC115217841 isoform X1 [Argonauta hians]
MVPPIYGSVCGFYILLYLTSTLATVWNINICSTEKQKIFHISVFNGYETSFSCKITSKEPQYCCNTQTTLTYNRKPKEVSVSISSPFKVSIENQDIQEIYVYNCLKRCLRTYKKLVKKSHWILQATRRVVQAKEDLFFDGFQVRRVIWSANNPRQSNTFFILPSLENNGNTIRLNTTGKSWVDVSAKLVDTKTSKTYSCEFLWKEADRCYLECSLITDKQVKIELRSTSEQIGNVQNMSMVISWNSNGKRNSNETIFQKLAYLPIFYTYVQKEETPLDYIEVVFKNTSKYFHIFQIMVTRHHSGEESGCIRIEYDSEDKYSCKLHRSRNWLLSVTSPELSKEKMFVDIFHHSLSSTSKNFTLDYVSPSQDGYIMYTSLKTYEDSKITKLIFYNADKFLLNSEISLVSNNSKYKFQKDLDRDGYNLVQKLSQMHQPKGETTKPASLNVVSFISVGILAVIAVLLICAIIYLVRCKLPRESNNKTQSKSTTENHQIRKNGNSTRRTIDSVIISEPRLEFCSAALNFQQQDIYQNLTDHMMAPPHNTGNDGLYEEFGETKLPINNSDIEQLYNESINDSDLEQLCNQPINDSDIEQLYTQPIKSTPQSLNDSDIERLYTKPIKSTPQSLKSPPQSINNSDIEQLYTQPIKSNPQSINNLDIEQPINRSDI